LARRRWRRFDRFANRLGQAEKRAQGQFSRFAFLWRWLRRFGKHFMSVRLRYKALYIAVFLALAATPYVISNVNRYYATQRLYDQLYPRYFAQYLASTSPQRARFYADYYAKFYAEYYASSEYGEALQFALPVYSSENISYPLDAPNASHELNVADINLIK